MRLLLTLVPIILMCACKRPQTKFDWSPSLSAPAHYPVGEAKTEFFYKGVSLSGASCMTAIRTGWGDISGAYDVGDEHKPIPDSVSVSWISALDNYEYKGGSRLPYDSILALFRKGYTYADHHETYYFIVAGMAPGGNVTIFLDGAALRTVEVARFKVKGKPAEDLSESWLHKKRDNWADELDYWEHHGVPYEIWEKGEKECDWGLGYSTESDSLVFWGFTCYTEDGTLLDERSVVAYLCDTSFCGQLQPERLSTVKKLPIHFEFTWSNGLTNKLYSTDVPLKTAYKAHFMQPYINPETGKRVRFTHLHINIEGEGDYASLWICGPGKREKLMHFKARAGVRNDGVHSGGYAEELQYFE